MEYDVAIIGAGPAGMTAGIFASRAGLKTACFEQMSVGGNVGLAYEIDNYPGIEKISGFDLSTKFEQHAKDSGVEFIYEKVVSLEKSKTKFVIKTRHAEYVAKKVILAVGSKARKLGLKNGSKYEGKGISYCASCDGNFYKGKTVAVVGGGYTALGDVRYLVNLAKKVYLINRSEHFRFATKELDELKKNKKVEIVTNATIASIGGDEVLENAKLKLAKGDKTIDIDALFVAIGQEPNVDFVKFDIDLDEHGYIKVKSDQSTSVKNLYACGDVTNNKLKQIVTACASGAVAANSCIGG